MTEGAKKLREAVLAAIDHAEHMQQSHATYVLRAVVEELGLASEALTECACGCGQVVIRWASNHEVASTLATLLEASGAER